MKIHFVTSAHNSLSQLLLVELTERGHKVSVAIASSEEAMVKSVEDQTPDLIIAPMLTKKVPESIWSKNTCLIVHPGILGDRGPSSLDWAIAMGEKTWGVSILQSVEEFDAGPIWATRNFPLGSAPGVLDTLLGQPYYLYGAHQEDQLHGAPGQLLAQRDGAVCVATIDGSIWISHLKQKDDSKGRGIKLPATMALGMRASRLPQSVVPVGTKTNHRTFREIRYDEQDGVGYVSFDFYNGAMSTGQCSRLRNAFLFARRQPTKVIVLLGGRDFFSNGIHLNVIEAAEDPALESWRNINAIDDLIYEILNTMSHLVIAGLRGDAGAGGAMLPLAADCVYARKGVILNPHYKTMGGLYGSEYWTYNLPRRVGQEKAIALTEECRPIGTSEAKTIGFIDDGFGESVSEFEEILKSRATKLAQHENFWQLLREKHGKRLNDEEIKPLASYRAEELKHMHENYYGPDPAYHISRQRFVYKGGRQAGNRSRAETLWALSADLAARTLCWM